MMSQKHNKLRWKLTALLLTVFMIASVSVTYAGTSNDSDSYANLKYTGEAYQVLNDNEPTFTAKEKAGAKKSYEKYGKLDKLGRCTAAMASIGKDIMPTEERGEISSVHPTGWQSNMGWERCHLIGYQLTGENANVKNLITGTRYYNVTGMLPFENMVADYVKEEKGAHVLYRVTPYFKGDELVARGSQMEAWSVEDDGDSICFNVYVFNVKPDATINYSTGVVAEVNSDDKSSSSSKTLSSVRGISSTSKSSTASKQNVEKAGHKVYWTPGGSVYHYMRNCSTLSNSTTVKSGTVAQSGKARGCKVCTN